MDIYEKITWILGFINIIYVSVILTLNGGFVEGFKALFIEKVYLGIPIILIGIGIFYTSSKMTEKEDR